MTTNKRIPWGWGNGRILRVGMTHPISMEKQREALNIALPQYLATLKDGRVSRVTSKGVYVQSRSPVNHVMHFIMTMLTAGIWAFIWLIANANASMVYTVVSVDEYGTVVAVPSSRVDFLDKGTNG